jgi:hypothetical protein
MNYLFLPGNSKGNKEWIDSLAQEFEQPKVVIHYNHWDRGEQSIDFEDELKKIDFPISEEITLVCKSIGCVLALKAMDQRKVVPKNCFFIGFPLFYINNHDIKSKGLLRTCKPITFIQKPKDPQAGFKHLEEEISYINNEATFIEYKCPGEPIDNHHYGNTKYLKEIITS